MPFNLLLFPILGGYYVVVRSELYRYEQQRVDRQKLIFNSIFAGIILLCISWVFTGLISHVSPEGVEWMRNHYPVYSGYRDKEMKTLHLTTQYLDVYAPYISEGTYRDIRDITTLVIRIDEVVTATKFDDDMYQRFMNQPSEA